MVLFGRATSKQVFKKSKDFQVTVANNFNIKQATANQVRSTNTAIPTSKCTIKLS